jgi:hypothetical protein
MSFNYDEYKKEAVQNKTSAIRLNAKKEERKKARRVERKTRNPKNMSKVSKTGTPVGTAFPNINTSFSHNRYGVRELAETAKIAPVSRSLWQLQLITFKYFDFKIVPPYKEELNEEIVAKLEPKLEKLDRKINTVSCCSQAMYDVMTYGSAIFEIVWGDDEDGWISPIALQRLPPPSFVMSPPGITSNNSRYQCGNLLKGIVLDKSDNTYHYYQVQDSLSGIPKEIPSENIIHIKDRNSICVDGDPYLAGIVPTVSQLELARKRMMQAASRCGTPTMKVKVGVPKEYLEADVMNGGGLSGALPGETDTLSDRMYTQLWDQGCIIAENQTADVGIVYPEGIDVDWQRPSIPINPTEFDQYLIRETVSHIFPRDALEVLSPSMSTNSNPLLELLKHMVSGWQQICAIPFENDLWTKFLIVNGFDDYRIELEWSPPVPEDIAQRNAEELNRFNNHVISWDEYRANVGLPPLMDEQKEQVYDEMLKFKVPQSLMQQPGAEAGGLPMAGEARMPTGEETLNGEESFGGEEAPEEDLSDDEVMAEGDALLAELEKMGLA